MKPRIFIGSSAEAVKAGIVDYVQNKFSDFAESRPWILNDVFSPNNQGTLDTLIKEAISSDFGLFVATADDLVLSRDSILNSVRDNVIFEFALFLGILGKNKTFLLVEEGVTLPSDLKGVNLAHFNRRDALAYNSLEKKCDDILSIAKKNYDIREAGWLPSTALAFSYYNGFVTKVSDELLAFGDIKANSTEYKDFKLHIMVPSGGLPEDLVKTREYYNRKENLAPFVIDPSQNGYKQGRGYGLFLQQQPAEDGHLHLYDVPTILNTLTEVVMMLLSETRFTKTPDRLRLEERELANFVQVLQELISRNDLTKRNVIVEYITD